jgi:hypothetical protein
VNINLSVGELMLAIEALEARASRHESMARFNPSVAGPHDRKAADMRKLRDRLQRTKGSAAA